MVRRPSVGARRTAVLVTTIVAAAYLASSGPSSADVSAVKGTAFGYFSSVNIFNQGVEVTGPTPTVSLPSGGSASPITGSAPSASVVGGGVAPIFSSGAIAVSTQGSTGPSGSVTSSADIQNVNTPMP